MPLSEHEQRILAELEESLVRHDPAFAQRVRSERFHPAAAVRCRWAVVAFVAGLAVLVAFYSQSVLAGLAGVALMFGAAVVFERNLRRMGRIGWHVGPGPAQPEPRAEETRGPGGQTPRASRPWLRGLRPRRDR